jgi:hypothetical protein
VRAIAREAGVVPASCATSRPGTLRPVLRAPKLLAAPLLVLLVVAGCGGLGASGKSAEKTIKADWTFNSTFPGRPALKGSKVDAVHCQAKPTNQRVRCTVSVTLKHGGTRNVAVIATFDGETLSAWDFATGPK